MAVVGLGVADVLESDGVPDTALDSLAVRCIRHATGHFREVLSTPLTLTLSPEGEREGPHSLEELCYGYRAVDDLAGDHLAARLHRVANAELDRVHAQRGGQFVHLRLMRVAVLDRAETAHRATRRVVGVGDDAVDRGVGTHVRPDREARRVGDDRGRARRVRAAVEDDARPDIDQLAVAIGDVLVGQTNWRTMLVPDIRNRPVV